MLLWAPVIIGFLLFSFGIYFLIKGYKTGKSIKLYGNLAYLGLGLWVIGTILLMEPVFTKLPPYLSSMLPTAISFCIFIVSAQFLLKPISRKK